MNLVQVGPDGGIFLDSKSLQNSYSTLGFEK